MDFQFHTRYSAFPDNPATNEVFQGKDRSRSETKKVLVIDTDAAILEVMKIIITDAGYTFLPSLPVYVPEKISVLQPDLILIEDQLHNLPQGRNLSRSLKTSALTSSIPVVMMTTVSEPEGLISESGADTLLIKPFDITSLEDVLQRCAKESN